MRHFYWAILVTFSVISVVSSASIEITTILPVSDLEEVSTEIDVQNSNYDDAEELAEFDDNEEGKYDRK